MSIALSSSSGQVELFLAGRHASTCASYNSGNSNIRFLPSGTSQKRKSTPRGDKDAVWCGNDLEDKAHICPFVSLCVSGRPFVSFISSFFPLFLFLSLSPHLPLPDKHLQLSHERTHVNNTPFCSPYSRFSRLHTHPTRANTFSTCPASLTRDVPCYLLVYTLLTPSLNPVPRTENRRSTVTFVS